MKIETPTSGQGHGAWTCVSSEPYERKDGGMTELFVWQRLCRACGAPFSVKTTRNFRLHRVLGLVNCPEHRGAKEQKKANTQKAARKQLATRVAACDLQRATLQLGCNSAQICTGQGVDLQLGGPPALAGAAELQRCGQVAVQPPGDHEEKRAFAEPAEIFAEGWTCLAARPRNVAAGLAEDVLCLA